MPRILVLVLSLLLAACASPRGADGSRSMRLVDLTPAFTQQWERSRDMGEKQRVAALKAYFADLLPGYYVAGRIDWMTPEQYDDSIARALSSYPNDRAGIEEVSRRFTSMFDPALATFESKFGPMTGYPPVYLVHSVGEFDGGTRQLTNGRYLIFGADVIARIHLGHNIRPFFHHELFHVYHERRFPACDAIWCMLWSEGLAVHVAEQLNSGASDAELLLTMPSPIRAGVDANRALAICSAVAKLDATDGDTTEALFSSGEKRDPKLPARYGYYVGYLAAAHLGKTYSLDQLASLRPTEVRPILERTLRSMGSC